MAEGPRAQGEDLTVECRNRHPLAGRQGIAQSQDRDRVLGQHLVVELVTEPGVVGRGRWIEAHVESQEPGPVLHLQLEAAGWPFAAAQDVHYRDVHDRRVWRYPQHKVPAFGRAGGGDFAVQRDPAASELAQAARHVDAESVDVLGRNLDH